LRNGECPEGALAPLVRTEATEGGGGGGAAGAAGAHCQPGRAEGVPVAHRGQAAPGLVGHPGAGTAHRAYARGDYRQVSKSTIILIAAALTYFVSPIDAIFDSLPLGGFLDDAAVLAWVVSEVRAEIEAFRLWEAMSVNPALPSVPPTLPPTSSAA
jgi:uncharacterized membrane protein YkvA (DUF1232 family)